MDEESKLKTIIVQYYPVNKPVLKLQLYNTNVNYQIDKDLH